MKHMKILERSWEIFISYRTLWVFGIILAVTSFSGSSGGSHGGGGGGGGGEGRLAEPLTMIERSVQRLGYSLQNAYELAQQAHWEPWMVIAVIAGVVLALALAVLFTTGRFVSQAALIRMVDRLETSGERVSWREGFRLGWSRSAWRLFLISLLVGVTLLVGITLLGGVAAIPLILGSLVAGPFMAVGIVLTVILAIPLILLLIAVLMALSGVMEIIFRACVLDELGVMASMRHGWQAVRANFADVGLMWLLALVVQLAVGILMFIVGAVFGMLGLLLGGGLGGLLYLFLSGYTYGWVVPAFLGGTLFILILAIPLSFMGGLLKTYLSTVWTLTYLELRAGANAQVQPA